MKQKFRSEFTRRQKMIRDNFEIYYYNDSHFQSVSLHKHRYYEFYFPIKGSIEMEIDHQITPLKEHDIVIVPPGIMHRALTDPKENSYCRYVFWVSSSFYEKVMKDVQDEDFMMNKVKNEKQYIFHFTDHEYAQIFSGMLRLMEEDKSDRFGKDAFLDLYVKDLILTISRTIYEQMHHDPIKDNSLFSGILAYIEQHLDEELSLELLGNRFYTSKYYISHMFKDNLGISIHQYILKKRLDHCAMDIASGKTIQDTYKEYGFKDYSSFFRAFKKQYHVSPRDYQKTKRNMQI